MHEIARTNCFSHAESNKFVILEMDSSNDISTKLLVLPFSQEKATFVNNFAIELLLTLFHAAFFQVKADNTSILVESLLSLSPKLAIACFHTSWQQKTLKFFNHTPFLKVHSD